MSAPTHILTLKSFPTMGEAYSCAETLYARFKAAHKRAEKVDIFIASSGPAKDSVVQIRVHYTREHEADARWFENEIGSI